MKRLIVTFYHQQCIYYIVVEVQRLWRLLRDRFSRERRRITIANNSGVPLSPQWPLLQTLQFLDKHVKFRR